MESQHPEPPFLLLPLPSGPDEVDEAPIPAPRPADQTPVFSPVRDSCYEAKAGREGREQGGEREQEEILLLPF